MDKKMYEAEDTASLQIEERNTLHAYAWGVALSLLLTLVPFAMVYWSAMSRASMLVVIGLLALVQMAVHLRYFLHIRLLQPREDLLLILFSALLLLIMVAGTIWIMASLSLRMGMPMHL